jgi:hypothetical protein
MPRISVLLTRDEEARFAAYCEQKGHKKSTLIARLIKEHLNRENFVVQPELFEAPKPPARPKRKGRARES